jgi:acetyl esterase
VSDVVQAPEEGVLDEFAAEWFAANGALLDPPDEYTSDYLTAARSPTCPFPTRDVAKVTDDVVAGVPVRIYEHDAAPTGLVVDFHGGGFCTGSIGLMENIATELACASGVAVVSVEYRLAPEQPYPAGLDDCDAVTRWALAHTGRFGVPGTRVAIAGESAGGNVAAAVALRLRGDHEHGLAGQVLIYPALDGPSVPYASRTEFEHLGPKDLDRVWAMLCGDGERVRELEHDPYLVPLQSESLAGLPPALVVLAGCDGLRDEGRLYARRLSEAEVAAEELCVPGQPQAS